MKIYQVLNESKNAASYDLINPNALFKSKKECKDYISFLKTECGLETEKFTIKQIY